MKKGAFILSIELLQSIPKLIIISLTIVVIFASIQIYVNRDRDVRDIESHLLAQRFFYSKNCAIYSDNARAYPGIIDFSKFNENSLGNCYAAESNIGFKFTLKDIGSKVIKEIKLNDVPFDLCNVKNKNFNCYFNKQYVLYFDNNVKKQGLVDTWIIIKNE